MASDDEKKSADDSRFRELSPGKLLVWARERAGLSQEDVARDLYMTLTKVRALESDDYRHMNSDTFTRGYLRSYASFVKLDVVQVLAAYDRHAQKHGLVEEVLPHRATVANKPVWQFVALVLAALLMLWLISIWFFDNRKQSSYNRSSPATTAMDSTLNAQAINQVSASSVAVMPVVELVNIQTSADAVQNDLLTTFQSSSASNSANSSLTSSSVSSLRPSVISTQQASTTVLDKIEFLFTEECWLEVSDARGDVLVADLQSPGSRLQLQGRAPFDVVLGNSSAAQIELNGNKVSVVPALGTKVLSIKVDESTRE